MISQVSYVSWYTYRSFHSVDPTAAVGALQLIDLFINLLNFIEGTLYIVHMYTVAPTMCILYMVVLYCIQYTSIELVSALL